MLAFKSGIETATSAPIIFPQWKVDVITSTVAFSWLKKTIYVILK